MRKEMILLLILGVIALALPAAGGPFGVLGMFVGFRHILRYLLAPVSVLAF